MDQNQTKPADLTTAPSPFLGQRKDLSLAQTLHKAKYSLLIQSPGNAKITLIDFSTGNIGIMAMLGFKESYVA